MVEKMLTITVLGDTYKIRTADPAEDPVLRDNDFAAYCNAITREIVIGDLDKNPCYKHCTEAEKKQIYKRLLRHEIVHAFFDESGLAHSANSCDSAWSTNEEMVDWIAIQGPKIYEAWLMAGAL